MRAGGTKGEGGFTHMNITFCEPCTGNPAFTASPDVWDPSNPPLPWGRASVMWTQPTAYQMLPLRFDCLLLHQFNDLFFRDIWLPRLRWGKGWTGNKVGKCCSSAHLSPNIPIVTACSMAPLFCMVDPHCFVFPSKQLHAQRPPVFPMFTLNSGLQNPPEASPWLSWSLLSSFLI